MLLVVVHSAAFKGALSGLVSAAIVDVHAFLTWKTPEDVKAFAWRVAALRWAQGLVGGALTGAGYGALIG